MSEATLMNIPMDQIEDNPVALRGVEEDGEGFLDLMSSIESDGILKPILVKPAQLPNGQPKFTTDGRQVYVVIDGLHRTTAARKLKLTSMPASVRSIAQSEALRLQLIANAHVVATKRVEYAKHLNRIIADDASLTAAQLAKDIKKSAEWISETLGLAKLTEEIGKAVDRGEITISNAIELAKLPQSEQETFANDAMSQQTSIFAPAVRARVKELREAKKQGKDPNAPKVFVAVPHLRKFGEIKTAYTAPTALIEEIKRRALATPEEIVKAVLEWAVHMDALSIANAKADAEARKKLEEETRVRLKAERDKKKAEDSAKAAASLQPVASA